MRTAKLAALCLPLALVGAASAESLPLNYVPVYPPTAAAPAVVPAVADDVPVADGVIPVAAGNSAAVEGGGILPVRSRQRALAAVQRAADKFYELRRAGGYLFRYAADGSQAWGEFKEPAPEGRFWVQPPGTPAVGMAFLQVYNATGNVKYLNMAREAAATLVTHQQPSGGWYYYVDTAGGKRAWAENGGRPVFSTYDDDTTQSVIRFFVQLDAANRHAGASDAGARALRASLDKALDAVLNTQYPAGAWPQDWTEIASHRNGPPLRRASVAKTPPKRYPEVSFVDAYTLNDNSMRDIVTTLREAYEQDRQPEYLAALRKAGDFLIAAQLPQPTPIWAQQYEMDMTPRWARKFEPPAAASLESVSALQALLEIYAATGDSKYLTPFPAALAWFDKSELSPGKWSRFYELGTSRPMYVNAKWVPVYSLDEAVAGYGWTGEFGVAALRAEYAKAKSLGREGYVRSRPGRPVATMTSAEKQDEISSIANLVRRGILNLNQQGYWLKNGDIDSASFVFYIEPLTRYIELTSGASAGAPAAAPGRNLVLE